MDTVNLLKDFFEAIKYDGRISITHIGIYSALLQYRAERNFCNPIVVFSYEIMAIAKVSSAVTYRKCVKQLSDYGYIRYEPSFKKNEASRIYFDQLNNVSYGNSVKGSVGHNRGS